MTPQRKQRSLGKSGDDRISTTASIYSGKTPAQTDFYFYSAICYDVSANPTSNISHTCIIPYYDNTILTYNNSIGTCYSFENTSISRLQSRRQYSKSRKTSWTFRVDNIGGNTRKQYFQRLLDKWRDFLGANTYVSFIPWGKEIDSHFMFLFSLGKERLQGLILHGRRKNQLLLLQSQNLVTWGCV